MKEKTVYLDDVEKCVDSVLAKVGKDIVFGMPLGLGKPNQLANAFYRRAKKDPRVNLTILTALSLEKPTWKSELEQRFLQPFVERAFGDYVDFDYTFDLRKGKLPSNVILREFFNKPGGFINVEHAQQNYISTNYTFAYRDIFDNGANVVSQLVTKANINGQKKFSTSCNPEVTLDLLKLMREEEKKGFKMAAVGLVNTNLPFMYGDAVVDEDEFDMIIDNPLYYTKLFGAPKMAMSLPDYLIGLYASSLIKDDGTLQIGIGSLGDAIVYGLKMRQENNDAYCQLLKDLNAHEKFGKSIEKVGGTGVFDKGLVGSTEMLVDGYIELIKSGVVKRQTYNNVHIQKLVNEGKLNEDIPSDVIDIMIANNAINSTISKSDFAFLQEYGILREELSYDDGYIKANNESIGADMSDPANKAKLSSLGLGTKLKKGIIIHGGFFLGPNSFYDALNAMSEEERKKIHMTSVLNVNQLYNWRYASEELKILQRKNGRFCNAALMCTLSGAVVSDGLENGQVVSGVGGQYNFVSMAHALRDGRSILMLRATRSKDKGISSNIVWNYGHITIPRHLRDIIITEYGIADIRGKCDQDIIAALINIADSNFQEELLKTAKDAKKISKDYKIPDIFKNNYPERLKQDTNTYRSKGFFPSYPFGTDLTKIELVLGKALKYLKEKMSETLGKASSMGMAMTIFSIPEKAKPYLERLQLDKPSNAKEKMMQKMVVYALTSGGFI